MQIELLIIDPQVDFCDPSGALFVAGANKDCDRLAKMIRRLSSKIDDIHVTLDTHHKLDIAHPLMWVDGTGKHPNPFTIITAQDVANGVWRPVNPAWFARLRDYTQALEKNGRYPLCIWPPHCLIGTPGHNVHPEVAAALAEWEDQVAMVDYVTKGSNIWTEHYSAVQADVPDPDDPTTQLNTGLIYIMQNADMIGLGGEALSHCLANTGRDVANNFGDENIKKLWLLEDTCSNVTGFEQLGADFVTELTGRGMNVTTSDKFLA